ncbi:MAG TPA: hypothetical protein DCY20_11275, partial [Firmicutes bacterium]|nr:hypothetical protein [Bacillota bacterium]
MKIALINGSPRYKDSNSECVLTDLKIFLKDHEIEEYRLTKPKVTEQTLQQLECADVVVFAFPLYVDSIPSHLLSCLVQMEEYFKDKDHAITVYAIVNSGFYDAIQNRHALDIIKHWCAHCQFTFGQGLGIGGGEMLRFLRNVPHGKGPKITLTKAYEHLANTIASRESADHLFVSPKFPRWLYRLSGSYNWRKMAKA